MNIDEILNTPRKKVDLDKMGITLDLTLNCLKQVDNWTNYKRQLYGTARTREIERMIYRSLSEWGKLTNQNKDLDEISKIIFYSDDYKECLSEQNFKKSLNNIESYFVENGFLKHFPILKQIEQREFKVMATFTNSLMGNLRPSESYLNDSDFKFFKTMKRAYPQFCLNFEKITRDSEKTDLFYRVMYGFAKYLWDASETKDERFKNLGKTNNLIERWFKDDFHFKFDHSRLIEFDLNDFARKTKIYDSHGKRKKEILINTIWNYNGQMLPIQTNENSSMVWVPIYLVRAVYDNKFLIELGEPFVPLLNQFYFVETDIFNFNETGEDWFVYTLLLFEYNRRFEFEPYFIISQNDIIEYFSSQTNKQTYKNQKKRTGKMIDKIMERMKKVSFIDTIESKIDSVHYNRILEQTKFGGYDNTGFYNDTPIKENETAYFIKFKQSDKKVEYKNKQKKIKTDKE